MTQHIAAASLLFRVAAFGFAFFVVEFAAGWMSGSLAILSDSFNLLQSVLGFSISWGAVHMGAWSPTVTHTFGFARMELLGSMVTVFLNWFLAAGLLVQSWAALKSPQPVNARIMLPVALFALFRSVVTLFMLSPSAKSNQGIVSEDTPLLPTTSATPSPSTNAHTNINIRTAFIASITDTISSVLLLIASVLMMFYPESTLVDPICTILIALVTFATSFGLVEQYLLIILEAVPKHLCIETIQSKLIQTLPCITKIHLIRVWSLTPGHEVCLLKISVEKMANVNDSTSSLEMHEAVHEYHDSIKDLVRVCLEREYGICEVFIEILGTREF
ncbi:cation efflux protein [Obelidium mucronatum]|nr:cation efflux protein [Obelidium mucronatum]